jgi:hypothetical protein
MKKLTSLLVVLTMVFMVGHLVCEAASVNTGPITVKANIPTNSLQLSWGLSRVDSFISEDGSNKAAWTDATAMDFGDLKTILKDGKTNAGLWFSQYFYAMFFGVTSTSGTQYTITSQSAGLTGPGGKLPKAWGVKANCFDTTANAFIVCPEGTALGMGGTPADATAVLYKSAAVPTKTVTIRADYGIPSFPSGGGAPFTGHAPIPLTQKGGLYQGTVTITVTD